jgi:arylsulfatase A
MEPPMIQLDPAAHRFETLATGLRHAVIAAILLPWLANSLGAAERPPSVIVIVADDFGVGDIQAHYPANKVPTPALDRLVREGRSFTDAHSPSAVCTPSRYGLLTGRYGWRTRLQEWVLAAYEPPLIAADRTTLPGFLRQHGYHTACIGKWHLGWEWPGQQPSRMNAERNGQKQLTWDFARPIASGPKARGFDHYFGPDVPNFPPFTFIEDDRIAIAPTARYAPDDSQGIVLPKEYAGAPMAPGWEFEEILPALTRRATRAIHDMSREEKPFFLYFALTSPHEPVSPSAAFRGRSGIAPVADFLMETDWAVGEVLQALEESGCAGDTIVIFSADNGHSNYTGLKELVAAGHMPSGPYRGFKGDIWEGGHRVPFVVRWPGRVAAGSTSDQLLCLTDIFATVADVIGSPLPADAAEDSLSFLNAALGRSAAGALRTNLVNHSNHGEFAYREGPWKLVFRNQGPLVQCRGKPRTIELYHLGEDVAEKRDLAEKQPAEVARLRLGLERVVRDGASRDIPGASNDTEVAFDRTQPQRWAAAPP